MSKPTMIKPEEKTAGELNPVNYIQQGNGHPVILIHGLAASLFDWNDLIPELVDCGFSANALDLLGHGRSFKPAHLNEFNIANVYEHFNDWIESLHFNEPLILIGHSLGGYLAIQYALTHPERVRGIVLADPFFSLDQLPFWLRINYGRPFLSSSMIERTPEWIFRKMVDLTSLSIRNGHVLPESVRVQTAADYKRAHPGIFNIVHSIQDPSPNLSSLTQPTYVLWGSRDLTLAPSSFLNLLKEIPNSKGIAITGAGHVPHQSNPAEFNQLVLDFLRTLDYSV